MKREIKFRGLDFKIKGYWHYGTYHYSNNSKHHYILSREKFNILNDEFLYLHEQEVSSVLQESVSQYIGLKDKNGKEIYEGDVIVWDDGSKYKVEWHEDIAVFFLASTHNGTNDCGFDQVTSTEFEIISNIYENPELIQSK